MQQLIFVIDSEVIFIFYEFDKFEFEKVSEWDTTIQDTMEEYDNVER